MGHWLETDYGSVRVSERDGDTLKLYYDSLRYGHPAGVMWDKFERKAKLLIADCEKVAKFKAEQEPGA